MQFYCLISKKHDEDKFDLKRESEYVARLNKLKESKTAEKKCANNNRNVKYKTG